MTASSESSLLRNTLLPREKGGQRPQAAGAVEETAVCG